MLCTTVVLKIGFQFSTGSEVSPVQRHFLLQIVRYDSSAIKRLLGECCNHMSHKKFYRTRIARNVVNQGVK